MNRSTTARLSAAAAAAVGVALTVAGPADAHSGTAFVFEATNAADGNAVQVFTRTGDGALAAGPLVRTGGLGTGTSLASQGGVVRSGRHVLVVNAGSDTVTSFEITGGSLRRRDVAPAGPRPVSVTVHHGLVYVLAAGDDSISALRLDEDGGLRPIADSRRPLSGTATQAAQVQFGADGRTVLVTQKATDTIDTFRIGRDGRAGSARPNTSAGRTPYGFDVDRHGTVVVSEAASASLSSYRIGDGRLRTRTAALGDGQGAPCWVVVDGDVAYTTNAATNNISAYRISAGGRLELLAGAAATTGAGPTDLARSDDGRFVFARLRDGSVASFAVGRDGALRSLGTARGAAATGPSGLAAS